LSVFEASKGEVIAIFQDFQKTLFQSAFISHHILRRIFLYQSETSFSAKRSAKNHFAMLQKSKNIFC
jgi:hypothetical protein